jgi:DNA invertase Pin-like site-specific DNA recombinase
MGRTTPKADPRIVVGYIRASTEEQHLGPDAQRAALTRWCEANGARLVAVHEDLGVSGAAALDERPGLLAAVAALREHRAGVLLVAKRDRLARDVVVAAMVERLAERQGARVLSADGTGNGEGPEAGLMRSIVDAFAQYERALISQRTAAALAAKRARGERVGQVPLGRVLADDGRRLEEHGGEARALDAALRLRARGASWRAIAATLEREHPRSNGRRWHARSLCGALSRVA